MDKSDKQTQTDFNPLDLPNKITRKLKRCSEVQEKVNEERIRYLWMHVCREEADSGGQDTESLTLDEWLNIVDEAAALSAKSVIISAGSSLSGRPEVWTICQWAQETYNMLVAIYLYSGAIPLGENELESLAELDKTKLRVVADKSLVPALEPVRKLGVPLYGVDTIRPKTEERSPCDLPFTMTYVESHGNLYTCGLVMDEEHYWLGNACEKRLDAITKEDILPSPPPKRVMRDRQLCNTCPRMIERILGANDQEM